MRYKCIVKCFWKGQMFSPNPGEGKTDYAGDDETPKTKSGRPYFEALDPIQENQEPKTEGNADTRPAFRPDMAKWELKVKLTKLEVRTILRDKYKKEYPEEATKAMLDDELWNAMQGNAPSNRDIAEQLKG